MTSRQPFIHATRIESAEGSSSRRVVFLHGLFGRGKNFTRIANGLLPEMTSLLVDLPNHGESEHTDRVDYIEIADQVAEFLRTDFAADGPVDVVGHSMGGKVAMVLALRHPELVRRLVVVDISPRASSASQGGFSHLLSALRGLDLSTIERRPQASEALRAQIPSDTVRGFLLQNLIRVDDGFIWQPNLALLDDAIDVIMSFPDMTDSHYDNPVLWIDGVRSDYVTDEDEPLMRELFPHVHRLRVPDAGHWVHAEKPDEVITALRTFLLN